MKPRLLDLFSGAGGCAMGYHMAGFDVVTGVDISPQPRYPFDFVQADALDYLEKYGHEYDFIHASPPCQAHTSIRYVTGKQYLDLIPQTRELLKQIGVPWVIENVPGAPLRTSLCLCGTMFGLNVVRHRLFEFSFEYSPSHMPVCQHQKKVVRHGRRPKWNEYHGISGHIADVELARVSMGISWMTGDEISQAIPPAYTQYIGAEWLKMNGFQYTYPEMNVPYQLSMFGTIGLSS